MQNQISSTVEILSFIIANDNKVALEVNLNSDNVPVIRGYNNFHLNDGHGEEYLYICLHHENHASANEMIDIAYKLYQLGISPNYPTVKDYFHKNNVRIGNDLYVNDETWIDPFVHSKEQENESYNRMRDRYNAVLGRFNICKNNKDYESRFKTYMQHYIFAEKFYNFEGFNDEVICNLYYFHVMEHDINELKRDILRVYGANIWEAVLDKLDQPYESAGTYVHNESGSFQYSYLENLK